MVDIRVQLKDGTVFEMPINTTTTTPQTQMFFIKDINGKVWEVNAYAIKQYMPYTLGLMTTKKILMAHNDGTFYGLFVYGDLRSGKSVFALHLLSQVYGESWEEKNVCYNVDDEYALPVIVVKKPNWFAFRDFMVFLPDEFEEAHRTIAEQGYESGARKPLLVWDDAGVWLNKHEHYKEWARNLVKKMQIVGSAFGSICFTSPNYEELLKGIREIPGFRWGCPARILSQTVTPFYKGIKIYTTKNVGGLKRIYLEHEDRYGIYYQQAFDEYQRLRRKYLEEMEAEMSSKEKHEVNVDAIETTDLLEGEPSQEFAPDIAPNPEFIEDIPPKKKRERKKWERLKAKEDKLSDWKKLYKGVKLEDLV